MLKRVLILGDGGSGKSTFAVKLGSALKIPVTHLDLLRCGETFQGVPADVYQKRHDAVLAQEKWIIEGVPRGYEWHAGDPLDSPTFRARLDACDAAVFLDYSPLLMLWRSFQRSRRPGPDASIPAKANYEFNRYHFHRAWNFRHHVRPRLLRELEALEKRGIKIVVACDDAQAAAALAELAA